MARGGEEYGATLRVSSRLGFILSRNFQRFSKRMPCVVGLPSIDRRERDFVQLVAENPRAFASAFPGRQFVTYRNVT